MATRLERKLLARTADASEANPLGGTNRLAHLLASWRRSSPSVTPSTCSPQDAINFGVHDDLSPEMGAAALPGRRPRQDDPARAEGSRRYTTRSVTKKIAGGEGARGQSPDAQRSESTDTTRVDEEIVKQGASRRRNFNRRRHETFGGEGHARSLRRRAVAASSASESAQTKKEFRESVLKSAQEYRAAAPDGGRRHRELGDGGDQLPRDPEPERRARRHLPVLRAAAHYRISEKLHQLTPVILVANDVPAPHEIDDAWLIEHDWILRPRHPRRFVPAGARVPDEELRRRGDQHPASSKPMRRRRRSWSTG